MTPNPFDQACRYLTRKNPAGIRAWLWPGLPAAVAFRGWLDTRSLPFPGEPERVCDTVAHFVGPSSHWALPIEFQRVPAADMFGRLLEYLGRVWRELPVPCVGRQQVAVAAAVINLTGRGTSSRTMKLPGTATRTVLDVTERNLADEDAATTLRHIEAGAWDRCLLPWIPLMQGGNSAVIIAGWKEVAASDPSPRRRGDWAGLALVFADAAGTREIWKRALEGWNVETSQQVLEWQAEARLRGIKEGEVRGEARGEARGKAQSVLEALRLRFDKKLPKKLQQTIAQTEDLDRLHLWFEAAITAPSLDDFRNQTGLS